MVKLFYAKINEKPPEDCLRPTPTNAHIFRGHISIYQNPSSDINSKKVSVHCVDSLIGQKPLNINPNDIKVSYQQNVDGNKEHWSFEHYINNPNNEVIILNFFIKYSYINVQNGKTEEHLDNNDSKNYTISSSNSNSIAPLVLGESDIALYNFDRAKPCEPYGGFLRGAYVFLKNHTYTKAVTIKYPSRRINGGWEKIPNPNTPNYEATSNWLQGYQESQERWGIEVKRSEIQSTYNLSCVYTYPDGRIVECIDNNFGKGYNIYPENV
jgi:hypothetical protein